jgi:hypothetical protein
MISSTKNKHFSLLINPCEYHLNIQFDNDTQIYSFIVKELQTLPANITNFNLIMDLDHTFIDTLSGVLIKNSKQDILINLELINLECVAITITSDIFSEIFEVNLIHFSSDMKDVITEQDRKEDEYIIFSSSDLIDNILLLMEESPKNTIHSLYIRDNNICAFNQLLTLISIQRILNIDEDTVKEYKRKVKQSKQLEIVFKHPTLIKSIFSSIKVDSDYIRYKIIENERNISSIVHIDMCIKISKKDIFKFKFVFRDLRIDYGKYNQLVDTILINERLILKGRKLPKNTEKIQKALLDIKTNRIKDDINVSKSKICLDDYVRLFSKPDKIDEIYLLETDSNSFLMLRYYSITTICTLRKRVSKNVIKSTDNVTS